MFKILVERFINGFAISTVLEFDDQDSADQAYDNLTQTKPVLYTGIRSIITKLYL